MLRLCTKDEMQGAEDEVEEWIVSADEVIQSPPEGPCPDLYRSSQRVIWQARQSVVIRKRS